MTNRARRRRATLRHWRNFATGLLIGILIQAPVFAATELVPPDCSARVAHGDWSTLLLIGSVVLLGAGLLLRFRTHHHAPPPPVDAEDSIGRYRPHIYRP
jgi:hypothetical protein